MQVMERSPLEKVIRDFITQRLEHRLDDGPLLITDSLFRSGRLDSLAAVELILFLEGQMGERRNSKDIELKDIDSIASILNFLGREIA